MSEKQPDVESALAAFGAPAMPYQKFNNGIVAPPNELAAVPNHRADNVFPLLAAVLPDLSGLPACPAATSADPTTTNGPTACAVPTEQVPAAGPGPGTPSNGSVSSFVRTTASAADGFAWSVVPRRTSEAGAGRASGCGQFSIAELFDVLGAPPIPDRSANISSPPDDLRQVFRLLERTD